MLCACLARRKDPRSSTPHHDGVAERNSPAAPSAPPLRDREAPSLTEVESNHRIRSFEEAKRTLTRIYDAHRSDVYCGCAFFPEPGRGLRVDLPACGYKVARDAARASRIEWEHAVAASTFGHTFKEWTEGDERCVDARGKRFRGRRCAEHSPEFARMEGDMHNLFPAVGEVNALRGDLPMGLVDPPDRPHPNQTEGVVTFGACRTSIENGTLLPRAEVRGDLARAALYMDRAYPTRRILDEAHRALFLRWSAEDPPDAWEIERNRRIAERQGNENPFIAQGER